jgi:hypothetical protein
MVKPAFMVFLQHSSKSKKFLFGWFPQANCAYQEKTGFHKVPIITNHFAMLCCILQQDSRQ